jgi:E3 ubiquitin-protein ligase BRE1
MTLVEVGPVLPSSNLHIKMEDRKRPASYDHDDFAPPHKKHAASNTNGTTKGHQDSDIPGKDDLEV